jgi:hypothetical protein
MKSKINNNDLSHCMVYQLRNAKQVRSSRRLKAVLVTIVTLSKAAMYSRLYRKRNTSVWTLYSILAGLELWQLK